MRSKGIKLLITKSKSNSNLLAKEPFADHLLHKKFADWITFLSAKEDANIYSVYGTTKQENIYKPAYFQRA